ncbi:uncharacterized protein LOC131884086 [Tigriopus californicus]|uniref:uncharacterized protein LOC131884086 n=1 Tax=Tigriopus californicus TaxID=6832 RepID=UPI0027DA9834|nr:uncharacterized protein LOC131884086 [Tigriopus californicus]
MFWRLLCLCLSMCGPLAFGGPLSEERFLFEDMTMDPMTRKDSILAFDSIEQDINSLPPRIQPSLSSNSEEFWSPRKAKTNKSKALQYLVHEALMHQQPTNIDHSIKFSVQPPETTPIREFVITPRSFVRTRVGSKTGSKTDLDRISRKVEEVPIETTTPTLAPSISLQSTMASVGDDIEEDLPSFYEDPDSQNSSDVKARVINWKIINHGKQTIYIL